MKKVVWEWKTLLLSLFLLSTVYYLKVHIELILDVTIITINNFSNMLYVE